MFFDVPQPRVLLVLLPQCLPERQREHSNCVSDEKCNDYPHE
jgi:hypothetical protein